MKSHGPFRRGSPPFEKILYCNGCHYSKGYIAQTGQRCVAIGARLRKKKAVRAA